MILNPAYHEFQIPKKNHSFRNVQAPEETLKDVQRKLNEYLQLYYFFAKPDFVHGFVIRPKGESKMCNIVSNALSHVGQKYVLNIDLKDFFSSISAKEVYQLFQNEYFNFNEQIAKSITFLTTYKGFLPTGAPTSPVISNFICLKLDDELNEFCTKNKIIYTRYADDLTFSSKSEFNDEFVTELKKIIETCNLNINKRKIYIRPSNRKQTVTGLIVNEKVNVDRKLLKKVRAMLHNLKKNGLNHAAQKHFIGKTVFTKDICSYFLNQLDGYINFIGQVRGKNNELYLRFKTEFNNLNKLYSTY